MTCTDYLFHTSVDQFKGPRVCGHSPWAWVTHRCTRADNEVQGFAQTWTTGLSGFAMVFSLFKPSRWSSWSTGRQNLVQTQRHKCAEVKRKDSYKRVNVPRTSPHFGEARMVFFPKSGSKGRALAVDVNITLAHWTNFAHVHPPPRTKSQNKTSQKSFFSNLQKK